MREKAHETDKNRRGPCPSVSGLSRGTLATVDVRRGQRGFGFTLSGQCPCVLSNVVKGSPADDAGLGSGDRLVAVNEVSVANLNHDDVVTAISNSHGPVLRIRIEKALSLRAKAAVVSDDEEYMLPDLPSRPKDAFPAPWHARASSADSTFEPSPVRRPKRQSPRKRQPKRIAQLGGEDELQLMTDREVNTFLHPTLNELRKSIKQHNTAKNRVDVFSSLYKAVVGYLGTIEMPKGDEESSETSISLQVKNFI